MPGKKYHPCSLRMRKCSLRKISCIFFGRRYNRAKRLKREESFTKSKTESKMKKMQDKKENKKKILKIAGIVFGILTVLLITAALVFSANVGKQVAEGILYMNAGADTKANSIGHLEERGYDIAGFEEKYGPLAKETRITSEDGNEIFAETFTCREDGFKTAVLAHGLGGDRVSNYPVAEMYLENGWNVIIYDQRGAGDSGDGKITFGYYEKLDIKALVDYAKTEMKSEQVVVHGQSMGAATAALYAVTEHAEQNVDAVILDSCFDSMENMFLGVWRQMDTEGIPENYILACGDWYLKTYYDFGFADADILEKMKENQVPTLMLQMERDEMVPTKTANRIFDNIVAKDKKICYFDSEHIDGIIDYPAEYEEAVLSFLEER